MFKTLALVKPLPAVAILLSIAALDAFAGSMHLQIHGVSKHQQENPYGQAWNENNQGFGLRYQHSQDVGGQVGFFKNSYYKTTTYLLAQYTPLHIKNTSTGVFFGYASGYNLTLPLAAGFLTTVQLTPTVSLTVRHTPKVRFNNSAVTSLEVGYVF